jgi:hypothetical protein
MDLRPLVVYFEVRRYPPEEFDCLHALVGVIILRNYKEAGGAYLDRHAAKSNFGGWGASRRPELRY